MKKEVLGNLLAELDNLSLTDIERHKLKLQHAQKVLCTVAGNSSAPVELMDRYLELTTVIEGFKVKNPNADIAIYENTLSAIRATLLYIEECSELFERNNYIEQLNISQSAMIKDLQMELMQYRGIEAAIINNTITDKIKAVLKKIQL